MSDKELIKFLIAQIGSPYLARLALGGVSSQRFSNWRARNSIAALYRPMFRLVANRYGANLPQAWLYPSVLSVQPSPTSGGKTNGRAGKKQRAKKAQGEGGGKGKRQRPQQQRRAAKRRTTGRSEAAVAG